MVSVLNLRKIVRVLILSMSFSYVLTVLSRNGKELASSNEVPQ